MSYCLNPTCVRPENPPQSNFCRSCGGRLRLRDRYLALVPIGQGGFGRTFKAIDEDKPSKPFCAIKQFFPQFQGTTAGQKAAELFTQEAVALEQLNHAHIPKLLAYFITPDNRQYLVQEFIDGQNLKAELETQGKFSVQKIVELLMTLLPTLAYVHKLGFIHRDIKPENIIRRGEDRRLYLVDFGAAKVRTPDRSQLQGTTIGTPEFMAPEQAWGRAFPSSDLYSLGLMCIHLLTDVSPFNLYDDNRGTWIWRDFLSQSIDPKIGAILDKLIAHKPVERYTTAEEVQAALTTQNTVQPSVNPAPAPTPTPIIETSLTPIATAKPVVTTQNVLTTITRTDWQCINSLEWHSKPINTIAIFPNGQYLLSGDDGGTVAIWNLTMSRQPIATYCNNNSILSVAASPNLSQIASGDKNRKVQLRRRDSIGNSLQELRADGSSLDSHNGYVCTVEFSPDGKILASGGADRRIRLWNADTGKIIYTLDGHIESITAIEFMPNGKILISTGADRTIRFWDLESKQLLKTIEAHEHKIHALAVSRDGQIVVSGGSDCNVRIQQLGASSNYHNLQGHQDAVLTVAISPDSKTIASGSIDGVVNLWDAQTQQLQVSLQAHQSPVRSIVFHPLDRTLITSSWDRSIKVWRSV
jgi:serine/threonine protein kinase